MGTDENDCMGNPSSGLPRGTGPRFRREGGHTKVEVMLDLFSGRQNPRWTLTSAEITELSKRLKGLSPSTPKEPPGLGYRGIVITRTHQAVGIPERLIAYNGVLSITNKQSTQYRQDKNGIEKWVLDTARTHGYEKIIEQFRRLRSK